MGFAPTVGLPVGDGYYRFCLGRVDVGIDPYNPSGAVRHLPFQGRLKDSSALTGTSSRRGGSGEWGSPLRWVVSYQFCWVGRCGHRPLQNPPVTYGDIPLFKGDERLLRPVGHLL